MPEGIMITAYIFINGCTIKTDVLMSIDLLSSSGRTSVERFWGALLIFEKEVTVYSINTMSKDFSTSS